MTLVIRSGFGKRKLSLSSDFGMIAGLGVSACKNGTNRQTWSMLLNSLVKVRLTTSTGSVYLSSISLMC